MTESALDERLTTGVPGLDGLLGGGLPRAGIYMVEGPPGAGKTILANQICYHVGSGGGQAIYITLLAESHARMLGHLAGLSFFRAELVGERIQYASGFKVLEADGLPGLVRFAREMVVPRKAKLLVLDGLVTAIQTAPTERDYRKFVNELQTLAGVTTCTTLLLASSQGLTVMRPEHTMVDGIIELSDDLDQLRSLRHVQVRKLRGTAPVRGRHTLSITRDGVAVRPRIEAELLRLPEDAPLRPRAERAATGVPALDKMLGGGLPACSTTMLLGPSGSGKTLIGLRFLVQGAERGEPCVYFGFYERPLTLVHKGERVGLHVEAAQRQGLLQLVWEPFGEGSIDELGERLLKLVERHKPRRLVIDGLQGFQPAADTPQRLGGVFSALAERLELEQVTTMYSLETPELLAAAVESPIHGVSAITHNIIVLRHVELDARLYRTLAILKMRDSGYEPGVRELKITSHGIELCDTFRNAQDILSGEAHRVPQAQRGPVGRGAAAPAARPGKHGHILIVDDEFGFADLMAEILRERGYDTAIAINGELGLQALRERRPDLVLLDVMMPVLSGPEMLKQMRETPEFAAIPVILMTGLPSLVASEQVGQGVTILQKPFAPERLFEEVERLVASPRGRAGV